jgi:ankyrin repeat protein
MDIFDAIVKRDIGQIQKLLEQNDAQNQIECDGITPLHFAVSYDMPEAVLLLLESGGDVNKANADGLTPLDYAIEFGYNNVVALFEKFEDLK